MPERKAMQNIVVDLAKGIKDGSVSMFPAVHELLHYAYSLDDYGMPFFVTLRGVDSEMDALPTGVDRRYWNADALGKKDVEIARLAKVYQEPIFDACEQIIEYYSEK